MLPEPSLTVAAEAAHRVCLGVATAAPVALGPAGEPLVQEMEALAERLASAHAGKTPGAIAALAPARSLYRSFRIDPTRTRPSSEALLRRILRDRPLPRILNAVDLSNLCSLQFLLPIGLFDAAKIRGQVMVREGAPGESYPGIRKDDVHLKGRPVVADDAGPFGNPTSDSLRTCVTTGTASLWMVIFAPPSVPSITMEENVRFARAAMERHLAAPGTVVQTRGAVWSDGSLRPMEGED